MAKEKLLDIELRVAATGQCFSVKSIPESASVQNILDAFMETYGLSPRLSKSWKMLHGIHILSNDTILSKICKDNTTLELICKIEGAWE
jgi:hypothetical protein